MATPKTSFTQEQIQNLSGIAQKFGGFNNQNFQNAVNTKYGPGAFTNFLGNVKNTLKSIPAPNVVPPPNTDMPVVPTAPADIATNAKQVAFDQANPVGTAMADVKYTPQPFVQAPEKAAATQTVPNAQVSGTGTVQTITPPPAVEKITTTTPEGTTTVKKETPGVATPDFNVGKGRESDIMANLAEGYKNDPAIQKAISTGDYNAYKSAYGYDTADSVKKGLLDSFFQARQPKTQESFFGSLITGLKIAKDKFIQSPEARNAQYRFDAIAPYKGASVETIYNGMTNGILSPGSQAYKDLVAMNGGIETPEMVLAKQKLANKQRVDRVNTEIKAQSDSSKGVESVTGPDATQTISDKVVREKGLTWAQKYAESVSNNPELVELATTIKNDSARKKEIERVRADIYKNIIEKHPGITKGAANLLAKRESEAFDEEYNNIIDTLNVNSADLRYKTSMLEKSFDYDYKEAQQAEERAFEAQRDAREFAQQKELAQFQQELGLKGEQAKFEQQMKQKAQIANDPVLATQDIIDTYAKMGILPERSSQEIIQSVQNDIAGGMTLGQSLTNLNKAFQSKDLYKAMVAAKTPTTKTNAPDWKQDATGKWYDANSVTRPDMQVSTTGAQSSDSALMQMLASGKAGGEKFFGVYASGDPTGENRRKAYEAIAQTGIAADLAKFPNTKITEGMIEAASQKTGIDPIMIATILKLDSSYGTQGKGARNNNPGNVGQFDSLDAKGITVKGYDTLQEGIDAVAFNLKKRYDALPDAYKKRYTVDEAASGLVGDTARSFAESIKTGKFTVSPEVKTMESVSKEEIPSISNSSLSLYRKYVEEGAIPPAATLKSMGITADQFTQNAQAGYEKSLQQRAKEINAQNSSLNVEFVPNIYSEISATQREKLNESINKITEVDTRMKKLMDIFSKKGTEILPTKDKALMQSLRQQIILKAKEVENLGVLNGPDLGILESIFPETNAIFSFNTNTMAKLKEIQNNYRSDAQSKAINYGAKLQFKDGGMSLKEKLEALRNQK